MVRPVFFSNLILGSKGVGAVCHYNDHTFEGTSQCNEIVLVTTRLS